MYLDVVDLREFYTRPTGRVARAFVTASIARLWPADCGGEIVGLGFTTPYLRRFIPSASRLCAFMPAAQGIIHWPKEGPNRTALVFDDLLPLPDACVSRILLVHSLEMAESPGQVLEEAWRILAPGGRILIVAPNRRGLWAASERTVFGQGRPFSRGQLTRLLKESGFTPEHWDSALHFPPSASPLVLRSARAIDRFSRAAIPALAGVLLVEAQKQMYQALPTARRSRLSYVLPPMIPAEAEPAGARFEPRRKAT